MSTLPPALIAAASQTTLNPNAPAWQPPADGYDDVEVFGLGGGYGADDGYDGVEDYGGEGYDGDEYDGYGDDGYEVDGYDVDGYGGDGFGGDGYGGDGFGGDGFGGDGFPLVPQGLLCSTLNGALPASGVHPSNVHPSSNGHPSSGDQLSSLGRPSASPSGFHISLEAFTAAEAEIEREIHAHHGAHISLEASVGERAALLTRARASSREIEASVAERAALAVLDDFTDLFNLENDETGRGLSSGAAAPGPPPSPRRLSDPDSPRLHATAAGAVHSTASCAAELDLGPRSSPPELRPRPNLGAVLSVIPEDLLCPISRELMSDPVLAADGHAYERVHIEEWLSHHLTSPLTGELLQSAALLPCHALRKMAQLYIHGRSSSS